MSITPPAGDLGGNAPTPESPTAAPSLPGLADGFTGIPAQFQSDPDFAGFGSLDDVLGEFKQLKGLHANREKNGLAELPGEGSTPEQQAAFWEKVGKPKSAAEYDFKAPENLPQGLDFSDERAAKFAQILHNRNVPKGMAEAIFQDLHNELLVPEFESGSAAAEAAKEQMIQGNFQQLEAKWGKMDSPQFEENHKLALKAFNYVADKDMADAFKSSPELASNPLVLDLLGRLGQKMNPDSAPAGSLISKGTGFVGGIEAVEAQIKKFHDDGHFMKMLGSDSNAKSLKEQWTALNQRRAEFL